MTAVFREKFLIKIYYFKWVNVKVCRLCLNKTLKKMADQKQKENWVPNVMKLLYNLGMLILGLLQKNEMNFQLFWLLLYVAIKTTIKPVSYLMYEIKDTFQKPTVNIFFVCVTLEEFSSHSGMRHRCLFPCYYQYLFYRFQEVQINEKKIHNYRNVYNQIVNDMFVYLENQRE